MKATLEFDLPEEKYQFDLATQAESYQMLLAQLIKDLVDLCHPDDPQKQPTIGQIKQLLNHLEARMQDLKMD